ncbi:PHP domain-containing protein [Anaerorhabdus sp.]|uniref:PHP domain-containing protein n=1 Tax=Anaerorhabdus sp. TaxID=1872524 RepID=UPI002FCB978E
MKDWHIHSTFSDSSRSVEEIIECAKQKGCTSISITDHDTTEGTRIALKYNTKDFEVIPGIEISAWDNVLEKEIHILGYSFDLNANNIRRLCENTLKQRKEIAHKQVEILQNLGYEITMNDVYKNQGHSTTIYKQHILKVLIEQGITDEYYGTLYKTLFKNKGPCQFKVELPSVEDAIACIHEDGGKAILAHPFNSQCIDMVNRYDAMDIDGIETYHSSHSIKEQSVCHEIANHYNWIETGGSDNHGKYGNEPEIGSRVRKV